eukprot:4367583-Amphidinium_carterae.1
MEHPVVHRPVSPRWRFGHRIDGLDVMFLAEHELDVGGYSAMRVRLARPEDDHYPKDTRPFSSVLGVEKERSRSAFVLLPLKRFALLMDDEQLPRELVDRVQDYMTRVLIARRQLQRDSDRECKKRKAASKLVRDDVEEVLSSGDEAPFSPPEHSCRGCVPVCNGIAEDAAHIDGDGQTQHVDEELERLPNKRRKWDLSALPDHIKLVEGQFQEHYICEHCGYKALKQARSPFFTRHWRCSLLRKPILQ